MPQTRLKQLREEAVLTVHELAEASGVSDDTISKIENGQRIARPSTLRKLAQALVVSPQELRKLAAVEEVALAGKAEAPETGPTLLEKALDAVRHDEEKESRARARLHASEGLQGDTLHSYKEDKFRAELRERGYPDEDFEGFIWPLIVKARQAEQREQENAQLREALHEWQAEKA